MSSLFAFLTILVVLFELINMSLNIFFEREYDINDIYKYIRITIIESPYLVIPLLLIIGIIFFVLTKLIDFLFIANDKYNPINRVVAQSVNYSSTGDYDKLLAQKNKKIYKLSKKFRIATNIKLADYHLSAGNLEQAYQVINNLKKEKLNKIQAISFNRIKIYLFLESGSVNSARELYTNIENKKGLEDLDALILEREGNLIESRNKLIKVTQLLENKNDGSLISIYNNLARIAGIFNNNSEKVMYYEKARYLLREKKPKIEIHIIYQNLIDTYLLLEEYKKAQDLLNEYYSFINPTIKYDLLEYYNYLLSYARTNNNPDLFHEAIDKMHKNIDPLLTKTEYLNSIIHEVRLYFNNSGIEINLLHKIKDNFNYYANLELPQKLQVFEIILMVITTDNGKQILNQFEDVGIEIITFYKNIGATIDNYIKDRLEDFQVFDKCYLLERKVVLMSYNITPSSDKMKIILKKLSILLEITDIYRASGNVLPSIESELNYIDECMGASYNELTESERKILIKLMKKSFEILNGKIPNLIQHPEMPPHFIRLARYALFLNMKDDSKKYFNLFLNSNISIHHFSDYIQRYFYETENALNNELII
ncbi:MAG: hypothetical protein M0P71_02210 [Melioribacteraceae bacterium]|nr:hypothetical protein [Melioribacteraceae bacterium]